MKNQTNVVIALDSFKGALSSYDAGEAVRHGILRRLPQCKTQVFPLGDGGEGTAYSLAACLGYEKRHVNVTDTHGDTVDAEYYASADSTSVVFDMSSCAGLSHAKKHSLDIMHASTYGVGSLIANAVHGGAKEIIVCLGGSGTSDGGAGALSVLGVRFFDRQCHEIIERISPSNLDKIYSADISNASELLKNTTTVLLYDSAVPLLGEHGAVMMYSRQKGADDSSLLLLEEKMAHFANVMTNGDASIVSVAGAGAAGGLGFGLSLLGGKLTNGAEYVLSKCGFEEAVSNATLVITGEGKTDSQTATGKLPSAVAKIASYHHVPTICLCGVNDSNESLYRCGITSVIQIGDRPMSYENSVSETARLLEKSAFDLAGIIEYL